MKIHYKKSIKQKIDHHIELYDTKDVDFVSLSRDEYIQFLEEISPTERVLLTLPERCYRGIAIRVECL